MPLARLIQDAVETNESQVPAGLDGLEVTDKWTGQPLAKLNLASEEAMEQAIAGSVEAREAMKSFSAGDRAQGLARVREMLAGQKEDFAQLILAEAGKPVDFSRLEVDRALGNLDSVIAEATRFCGEMVPMDYGMSKGRVAYTKRFPVGPVAAITPFNFPLNLVLHKLAPALAVGCPVVLKPSPQAPLTGLALAGLFQKAGFPPGAVSAHVCGNDVAQKLVTDDRLAMLSFTGSARVGWHLKSICGRKKVALELGGNAAAVVDETADLAKAAKTIAIATHAYAGQICISTQRVYVVESIFEPFVQALLEHTRNIATGDPGREGVLVGPLIDRGNLERVEGWVSEAVGAGGKILCGAEVSDREKNLYAPTWLTNTSRDMQVVQEEVFAPVGVVERVPDFDAAVQAADDTAYGLQAGVFTNRLDRVKQAHEQMNVGGLIINSAAGFRVDSMPYGGVRMSGMGREGARYAMEEMTEPRLLVY